MKKYLHADFSEVVDGLLQLSCLVVILPLDLFHFCIKSMWYDVLQDVLFERFTLVFPRVYNDIKGTGQRDENIMVLGIFLGGMSHYDTTLQPAKRPGSSDLHLLALLLICGCELSLKSYPRGPS